MLCLMMLMGNNAIALFSNREGERSLAHHELGKGRSHVEAEQYGISQNRWAVTLGIDRYIFGASIPASITAAAAATSCSNCSTVGMMSCRWIGMLVPILWVETPIGCVMP